MGDGQGMVGLLVDLRLDDDRTVTPALGLTCCKAICMCPLQCRVLVKQPMVHVLNDLRPLRQSSSALDIVREPARNCEQCGRLVQRRLLAALQTLRNAVHDDLADTAVLVAAMEKQTVLYWRTLLRVLQEDDVPCRQALDALNPPDPRP